MRADGRAQLAETVDREMGADELIARVVDAGSFEGWDAPPGLIAGDDAYAAQLLDAARRSGSDESVVTGEGRIDGQRLAVVVSEFDFLAGSIGRSAAERIVEAIERATAAQMPVLAAPASGGTRMQEGTPAFVEMIRISAAVARHKDAGLPYIVYLRHPTTGGVMASWGSLGHVTLAEPGALVGFLGPRVFETLRGEAFPEGVQTAENLHRMGLVDVVVEPDGLRDVLRRILIVVDGSQPKAPPVSSESWPIDRSGAWDSIERSRTTHRPGMRELLRTATTVVLLGDADGGTPQQGVLVALARFGDASCVVIGHDRSSHHLDSLGPASLQLARRGMRVAQELRLPLVSLVDTPGAALSVQAEEGGLARQIASCIVDLLTLETPSLTVLLGQGCGGGAIALLPANRIIAAQHAWLSPLPLEGASAIVHRTVDRAPEMARAQRVSSWDLLDVGIVDRIVPEEDDATLDSDRFCRRLCAVVRDELAILSRMSGPVAREARLSRYGRRAHLTGRDPFDTSMTSAG